MCGFPRHFSDVLGEDQQGPTALRKTRWSGDYGQYMGFDGIVPENEHKHGQGGFLQKTKHNERRWPDPLPSHCLLAVCLGQSPNHLHQPQLLFCLTWRQGGHVTAASKQGQRPWPCCLPSLSKRTPPQHYERDAGIGQDSPETSQGRGTMTSGVFGLIGISGGVALAGSRPSLPYLVIKAKPFLDFFQMSTLHPLRERRGPFFSSQFKPSRFP